MTAVREQPVVRPSTSPAQRLRATMAAVRVAFCWFGVRKTLTPEQKAQAADTFGAEGQYLSTGKLLVDTRQPCQGTLCALRSDRPPRAAVCRESGSRAPTDFIAAQSNR